MKTYLEQYSDLINSGGVIVGYWIRKEIENLIDDLSNPDYIYDTKEAHKRIKFMQTLCLQSKQPYYMKPISLMPWQLAYWEALYSFKMKDTGLRRFTETLLEVARKNGKSTMFAADGNTDLFIGEGGTDICCASNDDRQAKLIWREIAGMRTRLDPKKAITSNNLVEIRNDLKNITVFRLSSKTQNKDGFNISKTYLDESHDIKEENGQSEVAEACWRGMSSKDEPIFLNCTTQGFNRDCYLDKKIETAKAVIEGEIDDIHFMPWLYEQDSEAEIWQDESSWEKSNPSIRYGVKKTAKLKRDIETAKRDKGTRIHLLCKDFNIPQNTAEAWLMQEDFDYPQEIKSLEDFRGCFALAAVDLSETTDLTNAKILLMREGDNTKYVFSHYWIPELKLKNSDDKAAGAQYKEWAKAGYLTICEGNNNDLTLVADWLAGLKKQYGIKILKCGYDVKFSKEFINRMDDYGIETELIQQTTAVLSSPMKWVEADLKSQLINYGLNPVDKWCLGNASIQVDNLGRVMCVKISGQHSRRIDGAVTLIILYATLQRFRSEFMNKVK
jgi:phage terminase large subunit-like protein